MSPEYKLAGVGFVTKYSTMSALLSVVLMCSLALVSAGTTTPPPHTLEEAAHRLDMVLNNTRSRENYIRCFMDRGICNRDATNIKRILSDALSTNCSNCTHAQRLGADRFFEYLQAHQPETWVTLTSKYGAAKRKEDDDDDDDDDSDESEDDDDRRGKGNAHSQGPAATKGPTTESTTTMVHDNSTANSSSISIIF